MNLVQKIIDLIKSVFNRKVSQREQQTLTTAEQFKQAYENPQKASFTAIFANSLATMAIADSSIAVTALDGTESRRSTYIFETVKPTIKALKRITAQALGKGGKFLIPYVSGERVLIQALDQTQCIITRKKGDDITGLTILADIAQVDDVYYQRLTDYAVDNGVLVIQNRATNDKGADVPLENIAQWAGITPEIIIGGNVEKVPVGYLRCPRDSRIEGQSYGVPITFGADDTLRQLEECIQQIEQEYKSKKVFVGADELLFGKDNMLPQDGIFKVFRSSGALDAGAFWTVFDPAIRDSAYYTRYTALCAQLEKEVGTSRGILTERTATAATATEIRAALHDTWALVEDVRDNVETAINDLCAAVDLYAEHFGLTPAGAAGDFTVKFDWDMSMLESTTETFDQLSELESRGLISGARLNAWVTGQTIEDAQAEIDEVKAQAVTVGSEELEP